MYFLSLDAHLFLQIFLILAELGRALHERELLFAV